MLIYARVKSLTCDRLGASPRRLEPATPVHRHSGSGLVTYRSFLAWFYCDSNLPRFVHGTVVITPLGIIGSTKGKQWRYSTLWERQRHHICQCGSRFRWLHAVMGTRRPTIIGLASGSPLLHSAFYMAFPLYLVWLLFETIYRVSALHVGVRGEFRPSLTSKRDHVSGLENGRNLNYMVNATLGGQPFKVLVDTGR